jgi:hypothetical protein
LRSAAAVGALTAQASKWYGGKGLDGSERYALTHLTPDSSTT